MRQDETGRDRTRQDEIRRDKTNKHNKRRAGAKEPVRVSSRLPCFSRFVCVRFKQGPSTTPGVLSPPAFTCFLSK